MDNTYKPISFNGNTIDDENDNKNKRRDFRSSLQVKLKELIKRFKDEDEIRSVKFKHPTIHKKTNYNEFIPRDLLETFPIAGETTRVATLGSTARDDIFNKLDKKSKEMNKPIIKKKTLKFIANAKSRKNIECKEILDYKPKDKVQLFNELLKKSGHKIAKYKLMTEYDKKVISEGNNLAEDIYEYITNYRNNDLKKKEFVLREIPDSLKRILTIKQFMDFNCKHAIVKNEKVMSHIDKVYGATIGHDFKTEAYYQNLNLLIKKKSLNLKNLPEPFKEYLGLLKEYNKKKFELKYFP